MRRGQCIFRPDNKEYRHTCALEQGRCNMGSRVTCCSPNFCGAEALLPRILTEYPRNLVDYTSVGLPTYSLGHWSLAKAIF